MKIVDKRRPLRNEGRASPTAESSPRAEGGAMLTSMVIVCIWFRGEVRATHVNPLEKWDDVQSILGLMVASPLTAPLWLMRDKY